MKTWDFNEQLADGENGENYLDKYFRQKFNIVPVTRSDQRQGMDRVFTCKETGKQERIEYKTDHKARYTHNAFIETVSVDNQNVKGWAWTTQADLLFYYVEGDELVYILEPPKIRELLTVWAKQYPTRKAKNKTYWTYGVCVPLAELEACAKEVVSL